MQVAEVPGVNVVYIWQLFGSLHRMCSVGLLLIPRGQLFTKPQPQLALISHPSPLCLSNEAVAEDAIGHRGHHLLYD